MRPPLPLGTRDEGFTLIELLVSVAVMGFAAALLLGGIASAAGMVRRSNAADAAQAEVASAQLLLRSRLASLRAIPRLDRTDPVADVGGDERVLDFMAPAAQGRGAAGLQHYRLLMTAPGDLVLFSVGELDDAIEQRAAGVVGWRPLPLVGHVGSLTLAYYGAIKGDPRPRWRQRWLEASHPPELVRIRVGFGEGDRRVWPELVVRPGTTLDLACNPEPVNNQQVARCDGGRT